MIVAAIIVSASLVVIFTLIHFSLYPFLKAEKLKRRLCREGVVTEAVLVELEQTGRYINNLPQVRPQMKVNAVSGKIFVSETNEVMSLIELAQLRPGCTMKVRYNPCNMKEVMLVK